MFSYIHGRMMFVFDILFIDLIRTKSSKNNLKNDNIQLKK